MLILILILLLTTFTTFLIHHRRKTPPANLHLPPSPPGLPLLGNLLQLGDLAHRTLADLSAKYGDVLLLRLGSVPTIIISSPAAAQQVLKTQDLIFSSRPSSFIAEKLFYNSKDVSFAKYGEYWRQIRRISVVHMLTNKRVQSLSSIRRAEAAMLCDTIKMAGLSGETVNVSERVIALTNNTTCLAAFGRKYFDGDGKRVQELLSEFTQTIGAFPMRDFVPWLGWIDRVSGLAGRVERVAKQMDELFDKVLDEPRENNDSFVDVLLRLDEEEKKSIDMDRDWIKAQITDVFAAGTDTTYTLTEWVLAELVKNPTKMKKVQDEIRNALPYSTTDVIHDESTTQSMPYFKAVIKETLRLHPPLPLLVPHETIEDTQLGNYRIPAKTRVMINAWAIGRDPKSWERPHEFWPERFLNSEIDFKGQDFQLIPFGSGRRVCPGITFAMSLVELVLVNLLCHFDWELPNGARGEELDMSESFGITVHKKFGLVLVPKIRSF